MSFSYVMKVNFCDGLWKGGIIMRFHNTHTDMHERKLFTFKCFHCCIENKTFKLKFFLSVLKKNFFQSEKYLSYFPYVQVLTFRADSFSFSYAVKFQDTKNNSKYLKIVGIKKILNNKMDKKWIQFDVFFVFVE